MSEHTLGPGTMQTNEPSFYGWQVGLVIRTSLWTVWCHRSWIEWRLIVNEITRVHTIRLYGHLVCVHCTRADQIVWYGTARSPNIMCMINVQSSKMVAPIKQIKILVFNIGQ